MNIYDGDYVILTHSDTPWFDDNDNNNKFDIYCIVIIGIILIYFNYHS